MSRIPRDVAKQASPANAGRPATPKALRRKIDRLSRAAHRFHRFAHHPLCDRYAGEVIRIGPRARVCRGCTYAAIGGVVGSALGLVAPISIAFAATLVATVAIVITLYTRRRRTKLVTRMLPAGMFALAIVGGARTGSSLGLVAAFAAAASAGGLRVLYGRRGADRSPCATCPERVLPVPCSGVQPIISRERAFQRTAGRLLAIRR
jgi:Flp pilus assembly protein TadB